MGVEKKSCKTFGGNGKIYDLCSPKRVGGVLGIGFREIVGGMGVEKKSCKTFGGNKKIYDLCSPKRVGGVF
jgi:hypothetical protein